MTGENYAYLLKVDPVCNNNKFYEMILKNGMLTCRYGRYGQDGVSVSYPSSRWDSIYRQKTGKGYQDITDMVAERTITSEGDLEYKPISNKEIDAFVNLLQSYAQQVLKANYKVSHKTVTHKMINTAQAYIQKLFEIQAEAKETKNTYLKADYLNDFNEVLIKLYTSIPRTMRHVASHTAKKIDDMDKIIKSEQALLDVMRGQVDIDKVENEKKSEITYKNDMTILEKIGITIEPCDASDMKQIKSLLNIPDKKITAAYKVCNKKTEERYQKYLNSHRDTTTPKLLWHGSGNENIWSILGTGLMLRPNAVITGKMFGYGIYFAPSARKSMGYTSLDGSYWRRGNSNKGYMMLFETAYGNPYFVDSAYTDLDTKKFESRHPGHQVLHAKAGRSLRNDEIVFYREDQMTIRYVVEFEKK